ncbi:hypothetical protein AB0B28_18780 [Glycomyces sp. NPDC046736]|uniref:hypothetical protein n=1 Tax=Glycomyces sp. NPDC046736 TaxID=3155615 RepID=UPI0033DA237D
MPDPDELTLQIARSLEVDWQYVEHVDAQNKDRIKEVRSAGRKAGRLLGYKIVTTQSDPSRREDRRVVVIVAVEEGPKEDEERILKRGQALMEAHWNSQRSNDS